MLLHNVIAIACRASISLAIKDIAEYESAFLFLGCIDGAEDLKVGIRNERYVLENGLVGIRSYRDFVLIDVLLGWLAIDQDDHLGAGEDVVDCHGCGRGVCVGKKKGKKLIR